MKYCLGETDGSEIYTYEIQEGVSAIEYVFGTTSAFNAREYEDAIRFCEMFFDAEKGQEEGADAFPSLENLNAREEMMLHYHIQLIYAHAHFEYAKDLGIETEQGLVHMEIAEQECDVFEHSSKGLFYIGEKFQNLKNYIYEETGRLPEDFGDEPMMYEVD